LAGTLTIGSRESDGDFESINFDNVYRFYLSVEYYGSGHTVRIYNSSTTWLGQFDAECYNFNSSHVVYGESDIYDNPICVNISTFVPISENVLFACIGGIDHSATIESSYHDYRIFGLKYLSEYWIRGTKIWYFDLAYDLWGRDLTFEITEMNYSCYYYAPLSFHSSNITLINLQTNQKRKYQSLASNSIVTLEDWFITNLQTL
jgi:hypothetical protein